MAYYFLSKTDIDASKLIPTKKEGAFLLGDRLVTMRLSDDRVRIWCLRLTNEQKGAIGYETKA